MSGGDWKEMFDAGCEGNLTLVAFHAERGVDLNYAHPEFLSTPLVAAILAGQEAVALYLLGQGADPRLHSEFDGMVPMQAARKAGLVRVEARLRDLGAEAVQDPAPPVPARSSWWHRWRSGDRHE